MSYLLWKCLGNTFHCVSLFFLRTCSLLGHAYLWHLALAVSWTMRAWPVCLLCTLIPGLDCFLFSYFTAYSPLSGCQLSHLDTFSVPASSSPAAPTPPTDLLLLICCGLESQITKLIRVNRTGLGGDREGPPQVTSVQWHITTPHSYSPWSFSSLQHSNIVGWGWGVIPDLSLRHLAKPWKSGLHPSM